MSAATSFSELAYKVSVQAKIIDSFLSSNSIPFPSTSADAPFAFPVPPTAGEIYAARESMLDAAKKLYYLALGPIESMFELAARCHDSSTLHAVYKFDMASHVPLEGEIPIADVAKAIGIDEDRTTRVLRLSMTNGVFKEPRTGYVAHTAMSALLLNNTMNVKSVVGHIIDDQFPASCKLAESMERYPVTKDPLTETAFAIANDTKEPFFDFMAKHPARIDRFHSTMSSINTSGMFSADGLVASYDWAQFKSKTLVDVGGSTGHTALKIADGSEIAKFIVQDISTEEVKRAQAGLSEKYKGRVEFSQHDFFKPMPIRDADVFFFRFIFHDWPDKHCVDILRALIPAMKTGTRILINDIVLPEPNTMPLRLEKERLICDLVVHTLIGSCERGIAAWRTLFKTADARFKFLGATPLPGTVLSVVEAVWEETEN